MENLYYNLKLQIANCFAHLDNHDKEKKKYVRIHNKNFSECGEVSFHCGPLCKDFLAECAMVWYFPVVRLEYRKERCHLYLERKNITGKLIQQVLNDADYGRLKKTKEDSKVFVKPLQNYGSSDQDLTYHRVKLVHQTLQKLMIFTKYTTVQDHNSSDIVIEVTGLKSGIDNDNKSNKDVQLKCGPVIYPSSMGKTSHLTTDQFLRCRCEHIRKMALFRSRKVMQSEEKFNNLMDHLGGADVIVSLLGVKHTSPVQIPIDGYGGTKGALFPLYNSARLETILRTFEERIKYNEYEQLPEMKEIDWSILNEDEEWQLVFIYIAGFPDLIDRCVEHLERGVFAVHLIIQFLNGFVSLFSKYYIRVRILTEKREHLMPYVYARIYLLKAIREILNKTFNFLDIKPVESM